MFYYLLSVVIQNKHMIYFYSLLFIFIYMSFFAFGENVRFLEGKNILHIFILAYFTIPIVSILFIAKNVSQRLFLFLFTIYFIVSWLYLPTGLIHGRLNYGIMVSFFETNQQEAFEYIFGFSLYVYVLFVAYFLFYLFLINYSLKVKINKRYILNYLAILVVILFFFSKSISHYVKTGDFFIHIENNHIYPIKLAKIYYKELKRYKENTQHISNALTERPTWKILSTQPKYKNYVFIIGESVRREYMSMYGYPINNTPFLSSVNGIVFNNYISAGAHTQTSLERTLYFTNDAYQPIYHNHILNLLDKNIFKIYWLSNQGEKGAYDTMATRISLKADERIFFSKIFKNTHLDKDLKPYVQKAIQEPTEKHKFIVVHLMGSHSDFCKRIDREPTYHIINKKMSCYVESIKYTDELIEDIDKMLKETGETYSVMYFSDHAQARNKENHANIVVHNPKVKQGYHVPLIIFSSGDTKRTYIDTYKSGYDLIYGIAEWLGIREESLMKKDTFFSNQSHERIKVFNNSTEVYHDELDEDPVILPTLYKK